jgi:hypothetical protein
MVEIESDDPRLAPERTTSATCTAADVEQHRALILRHLAAGHVTRLIAIMDPEHAEMLMMLHEAVGTELGAEPFPRPPPGYVAPADRRRE